MKICLILDRLRSAHNTGNIFRIAEALGAEIIACGYTPAPPHPKLAKTAMGADRMVRCRTMPDAAGAVRLLRTEGYAMILAAEPGPESVFAWNMQYEFPLGLVFGNEALGVSPEALAEVAVDLSGRPWLEWRGDELLPPVLAREEKDVWREFYKAFTSAGRFNAHIEFRHGKNGHHLLESAAKGMGVALRDAVRRTGSAIPSTKGSLD